MKQNDGEKCRKFFDFGKINDGKTQLWLRSYTRAKAQRHKASATVSNTLQDRMGQLTRGPARYDRERRKAVGHPGKKIALGTLSGPIGQSLPNFSPARNRQKKGRDQGCQVL